MNYENWARIHKAYTKQNWSEIEAIYESAKDCPHTYSAYRHAMSIFAFPHCRLSEPKQMLTNSSALKEMSNLLNIRLPNASGLANWSKERLLGHIWWHWQNKAYRISHAKLAKIADTIDYEDKRRALAEFFTEELNDYFGKI